MSATEKHRTQTTDVLVEMNRPLKLLVVEDCEMDFELLQATLVRQDIAARCQRVMTEPQMRAALANIVPDAIICDHHLPEFSSDRALQVLHDTGLDLPFIIVSGTIGEDAAVASMRAGADDYLIKGRLARLGIAITNAISAANTRRQRQMAEEKLRQSEEALRALSGHLLSAVEAERTSMARDIHDEIGSGLTAIGLDLAWMARHGDETIASRARLVKNQIAELQAAGQRIIRNLRPPVMDAGLIPALEWQVRKFREADQTKIHFDCNNPEISVGDSIAIVV
ncbi:MAG: histidine kinase, partial [Burkholderiaceae bacterium]